MRHNNRPMAVDSSSRPPRYARAVLSTAPTRFGQHVRDEAVELFVEAAAVLHWSRQRASSVQHSEQMGPE